MSLRRYTVRRKAASIEHMREVERMIMPELLTTADGPRISMWWNSLTTDFVDTAGSRWLSYAKEGFKYVRGDDYDIREETVKYCFNANRWRPNWAPYSFKGWGWTQGRVLWWDIAAAHGDEQWSRDNGEHVQEPVHCDSPKIGQKWSSAPAGSARSTRIAAKVSQAKPDLISNVWCECPVKDTGL